MNPFVSEMSSFLAVGLIVAGLTAAFPFGAFEFRALQTPSRSSSCVFVTLDANREAKLLKQAKESWRKGEGNRIYADLLFAELPKETPEAVLSIDSRPRPSVTSFFGRERVPFLPSLGAPPPVRLPVAPQSEEPAFSREELLRMN